MHSAAEVSEALALSAAGLSDREVSQITGVPRRTVADWRHGRTPRRTATGELCAGLTPSPPPGEYAYLLGLYLGDGWISEGPRAFKIRFALDAAYPDIIAECARALEAIVPGKSAWRGEVGASTLRCIGAAGRAYFPSTAPGGSTSGESSLSHGSGNSLRSGQGSFFAV
jgi:hypothetical protein